MDHIKFKETENKYAELKSLMESGSLTSEDLKVKLKKMMIRDDDGNYWMIGSNTGKWYIYNGSNWKEKDPYSGVDLAKTQNFNNVRNETVVVHNDEQQHSEEIVLEEQESEITIENNDPVSKSFNSEDVKKDEHEIEVSEEQPVQSSLQTNDESEILCVICKSKIDAHSIYCNHCGANQKELSSKRTKPEEELLIRSVRVTSLVFFFGGLGLIAGIIFGATFGIFDIFGDLMSKFPEMLAETRGKIQGGLIFAALGGIGGFFGSAILFGFAGIIYNSFSYLFGGIRIRTR